MIDQQLGLSTNQIAQGQDALPSLRCLRVRTDRTTMVGKGFSWLPIHVLWSRMRKAMMIMIMKGFLNSRKGEKGIGALSCLDQSTARK